MKMHPKNKAFTLAEILITISIIGIIATMVLPTLSSQVNDYVFSETKKIMQLKINEIARMMKVNWELKAYPTTESFVDIFQKYSKLSQRCTSQNLNNCFSPIFYSANGEEISTSDLKTGANFGQDTYSSPLIGAIMQNGTTMIMSFNPDCKTYDANSFYNDSEITSCFSFLYDINGFKKPNKIGKDIVALNATVTTNDCTKVSNICVSSDDVSFNPDGTNYWLGAYNKCNELGMHMPSYEEMNTMKDYTTTLGMNGIAYWTSMEYYGGHRTYVIPLNDWGYSGESVDSVSLRCIK